MTLNFTSLTSVRLPCKFFTAFQTCRFGDECKFVHLTGERLRAAQAAHSCPWFDSPQGCKRGQRCPFLHTQTGDQLVDPNDKLANGKKHAEWRRMLPFDHRQARPLGNDQLARFSEVALSLVSQNDDENIRQGVIKALAGNAGLTRIDEIVKSCLSDTTPGHERRRFLNHLMPLLQAVTHPDVATSYILETHVGVIFAWLFGVGGLRSISLFDFMLRNIIVFHQNASETERIEKTPVLVETFLASFRRLLEAMSIARVMTSFQDILTRFDDGLHGPLSSLPSTRLLTHTAFRHLGRLRLILAGGQAVPDMQPTRSAIIDQPHFSVPIDYPGALSQDGPRHDNDHADIKDISILPSAEELLSRRPEYVPTTDMRTWHAQGLEGLLDRHFRLLREDTVGQLRDAVASELERQTKKSSESEDKRNAKASFRQQQGTRTNVYCNGATVKILCNKYKGPTILFEFEQLAKVSSLTKKAPKDWWQHSRRLQPGNLVCLLAEGLPPTFCVIATMFRDPVMSSAKVSDEPGAEVAKFMAKHNLFSHKDKAWIALTPADPDVAGALGFLRLSEITRTEVATLVEFPGIILPSFGPTLRALQRMSLSQDVQFADLLAPASLAKHERLDTLTKVEGPVYSMKRNFRFDLECLLREPGAMTLSAKDGFDVQNLVEKSFLDPGQAQAVVYALTRKLALIQVGSHNLAR